MQQENEVSDEPLLSPRSMGCSSSGTKCSMMIADDDGERLAPVWISQKEFYYSSTSLSIAHIEEERKYRMRNEKSARRHYELSANILQLKGLSGFRSFHFDCTQFIHNSDSIYRFSSSLLASTYPITCSLSEPFVCAIHNKSQVSCFTVMVFSSAWSRRSGFNYTRCRICLCCLCACS